MKAPRFQRTARWTLALLIWNATGNALFASTAEPTGNLDELAAVLASRQAAGRPAAKPDLSEGTRKLLAEIERTHHLLQGKPGKSSNGPGLISLVTEDQKEFEENPKKYTLRYGKDNPAIRKSFEWARTLALRVQERIRDRELPTHERLELFRRFHAQVTLPQRALAISLGKEAPDFVDRRYFEALLPKMPEDLFAGESGNPREKAAALLQALGLELQPSAPPTGDVEACVDPELELRFDAQALLTQDALTAGKAPTRDNYVRALKLMTVSMMLAQLEHHRQVSGSTRPIRIPQSCRDRLDADLPEELAVRPVSEKQREERIAALMDANGLSQLSPEFQDRFASQDLGDPKTRGFIGFSPFEKRHAAEAALKTLNGEDGWREPPLDERDTYDRVLESRAPAVLGKASKESQATLQGVLKLKDDVRTLGPAPEALIARMEKASASDWREVVPENVKQKLEKNRVTIAFPPALAPAGPRTWAVRELSRSLESLVPELERAEKREKLSQSELDLLHLGMRACGGEARDLRDPRLRCPGSSGKTPSQHLKGVLERIRTAKLDLRTSGDFDGPLSKDERKMLDFELPALWQSLSSRIPAATMSEWDLLGSQIGSNPFAGARLAALIEKSDLEKSGDTRRLKEFTGALAKLGLDEVIPPGESGKLLSSEDRKRLWEQIRNDHDSSNVNLFSRKADGGSDRYYDRFERLASTRTLDAAEARSAASRAGLDSASPSRQQKLQEGLRSVDKSETASRTELLRKIYDARSRPDEQAQLFDEYSREYEVDERQAGREAMGTFLTLDSEYKRPIYQSMIEKAAIARQADLELALQELCDLKPDDHEKFKKLVLSTAKSQEALNQELGLPGLPKNVQEELDRLSDKDWKDLKLGGLTLVLFVGSTLLLTVASGGLLAPALAAGVGALSGAMAIGATGLATASAAMWIDEKPDAAERVRFTEVFEELRLTNRESVERMGADVTAANMAIGFNLAMMPQGVKPTAQMVGGALRAIALKGAAGKAAQEAEVIAAEYLFGYRKIPGKDLPGLVARPWTLVSKVWQEAKEPLKLSVKSADEVTRDSTRIYAEAFGNRKDELEGFLTTLKSKISGRASRDANFGPNLWRRHILKRRELVESIDELLAALKKGDLQKVITEHNETFSKLIDDLPRRKRDWAGMLTIEGIPGLNTKLVHLKEVAQARRALLGQLGVEAAKPATTPRAGPRLLKEFREQLLSREASANDMTWKQVRRELLASLPQSKLPATIDELIRNEVALPPQIWKSPALSSALQDAEKKAAHYKTIAEFDEWLAIKRLQKEVAKIN